MKKRNRKIWYAWEREQNLDTDYEVSERYNYRRQKSKQAAQAKANQPLLNKWARSWRDHK